MPASPRTHRLGRVRRIAGKNAYGRVFGARCSAANRHLVIYAAPNGLPHARLGLSVGKKHGPAVQRNRIKRLIREGFRLEFDALPPGMDLVCIPRLGLKADLAALRAPIRSVAARAATRCRT